MSEAADHERAADGAGRVEDRRLLAGAPWSLRAAPGPGCRGAVEIYEGDTLVGLMVDTPVAPQPLRGARRAGRGGQARAIAWGRLPADGEKLVVVFARHLPWPGAQAGELARLGDWGWVAVAHGRFGQVQVCCAGRRHRRRLRAGPDSLEAVTLLPPARLWPDR